MGTELIIFSDERKKIEDRWDYHGLLFVRKSAFPRFVEALRADRKVQGYFHELKFGRLDKKGKGETYRLSQRWVDRFLDDLHTSEFGLSFSVTGVDTLKLDYALFGDDETSKGKYATVYNRFFRATLKGSTKFLFPDDLVIIDRIFHDHEGNLEKNGYFDWHAIHQLGKDPRNLKFGCRVVDFVDSDHAVELTSPEASECIQFVDVLLGAITHCIHATNTRNIGQKQLAISILPAVEDALKSPYRNGENNHFRRLSISHFPRNHSTEFSEDIAPGEYYRLDCDNFRNMVFGQGSLF